MANLRFAFEPGGEARVGVAFEGAFKDVAVSVDGRRVGAFADGKALRRGARFALADGSTLEVKLAQMPFPELRILRDGVPLPGSATDPAQLVRTAGNFVVAIGAISAVLGLAAAALDVGFLRNHGFGLLSMLVSVAFAALGVPAGRGSLPALAAAVALYVIDGAFGLVQAAQSAEAGSAPPVFVPIARILFLIPMLRGVPAAMALRGGALRRAPPPPPPLAPKAGPAPLAPARRADDAAERRRRELEVRAREVSPSATAAAKDGRDRAAGALRFVAPKLEILPGALRVVSLAGRARDVRFDDVAEVFVRRLPPDPPWNGNVLVDLLVPGEPPVRILPATIVNFAPLPGGAAPSRLENMRRLTRLVVERNPSVAVDPPTRAFLDGSGHPAAFTSVQDFARHDARFA
jgi:hypothetical protein